MKTAIGISVIIPVYNAEGTIGAALHSIKIQTEGNFEIIIVNDGSTDNSLEAIYDFKKSNSHLDIIVIDKPHEGVAATRNTGLQIASGNLIAFLDADDEWHPEKTIKQLSILKENPGAGLIGCHFKPLKNKKPLCRISHITTKEMMYKNFFQTSTVLMHRKVFATVGFFENTLMCGEERNYFLRVSKNFACVLVNENLINYGNGKRGFGQSGLSGNLIQMEIGEIKNLIYAYKVMNMPFMTCCNAIIFSLAKFMRRVFIVYVADKFRTGF